MAVIRQKGFGAGELAPFLYGRDDLTVYGKGLRRCRNFFISKHGAAVSRPGTTHVIGARTATATRLIPFVYADGEGYVIELGDLYARVWSAAGVAKATLTTTWPVASLAGIQYAQVGNDLYLATGTGYPRRIRRLSDTSWEFGSLDFTPPPYPFTGLGDDLITSLDITGDATHPPRQWQWKTTLVGRRADGTYFESAARTITTSGVVGGPYSTYAGSVALYSDAAAWFVTLSVGRALTPTEEATLDYEPVEIRVYRGRGNVFGFVGSVEYEGARATFIDYAADPDYLSPPPEGTRPLTNEAGTIADGTFLQYPKAVGFYEQRLILAGTQSWPGRVLTSATNAWEDFDQPALATDDRAVVFEVASSTREDIRAVLGDRRLLLFTDAGVYSASGAGGAPLTPTSIEVRRQAEVGAARLPALMIGGTALYVRSKGGGVQALAYSDGAGGYAGGDISWASDHLLRGYTIIDWCYAAEPWGVVWAVRSDGKLLSLSFDPQLGLAAWALHETEGTVLSVCSVPSATEDVVYLLVQRGTKKVIERFAPRDGATYALDCAFTKPPTGVPAATLLTSTVLGGRTDVYGVLDGNVYGPLPVDGSGLVTLPGSFDDIAVGLKFTCDLEVLDLQTEDKKRVQEVVVEVVDSRGLQVGETTATLTPWKQRTVADQWDAVGVATERVEVRPQSTWNRGGRVVVRQAEPLPLTVLGVSRTVEVGR